MLARFKKHTLFFKKPSGTSRGILKEKHSWFIEIYEENSPETIGTGECSVIPNLSPDFIDFSTYEEKLNEVCNHINIYIENLSLLNAFPSILFGLETALRDLKNGGRKIIFKNSFSQDQAKIPINGLIWMGDPIFMQEQIEQKLREGFTCLKMKIGAIDFDSEMKILENIRLKFNSNEIILRVDANGAFSPNEAEEKLTILSQYDIHSIEQPIKQGQTSKMKKLCLLNIVPIALDEELIGIINPQDKYNLLQYISPQFIILKPSLHGGFIGCQEWIEIANKLSIPWWITSALESNVGLNAIAQFAGEYNNSLPQGLGTGGLYSNNFDSNLTIKQGNIFLR
ncbi:MAG: o-succinylbenzoate synthase [Flavobacteriia bacterium]|nr:o-succinylbenzoate synthase [Flavobacteriia bacterium]